MYSSIEVAKYLGIQHKVLLDWCEEYYQEFCLDDVYDTDMTKHKHKSGSVYYMIDYTEISSFGSMLKGKRGLAFLNRLKKGDLGCDINDFLNLDNELKRVIRETVTVPRMKDGYMNDGKYYYHYTSLIYKILNIDLPKGTEPRDYISPSKLKEIEDLENKVANMILELSKDHHYKEVYTIIKERLEK
jgi:hypothetical protein